ncbi:hypothetical protein E3A20_23990 [Planctomyces bekefii]|uniref:Uncharacterized protein n=1 Tax=Planctomyces bekefii TaxID=1653850 RepID=A0A5C6M5K7_9PLAN|nr:hypothetical protein E3A20_23990 [Planctomyces bekefii]
MSGVGCRVSGVGCRVSGFEVSQGFLDCLPTSDTMYAVLRKAAAAKSAAGSDVSVASQRRAA